jgi:hypothetical protein
VTEDLRNFRGVNVAPPVPDQHDYRALPDRGWLTREFSDGRVLDLNFGYTLPRLTVSPTRTAMTYDETY